MDEAEPDGVVTCDEHDRDCRRCGLGRECRWVTSRRGDYGNPSANQIGRKLRQPVVLSLRPAVFDRDVLALHEARLVQPLAKSAQTVPQLLGRSLVEEPDHRHRELLRPSRNRPRRRRAAKQRDELAPPDHSITSSARVSSVAGISRPSALAVGRLMTNSNFADWTTGSSEGLAPLRMRPA